MGQCGSKKIEPVKFAQLFSNENDQINFYIDAIFSTQTDPIILHLYPTLFISIR